MQHFSLSNIRKAWHNLYWYFPVKCIIILKIIMFLTVLCRLEAGMLHRNQRTEHRASGFWCPQGPHSGGEEKLLLQWGSQTLAGEGGEVRVCPHVACKPRSCSWNCMWGEGSIHLKRVSLDAPAHHGDAGPGVTTKGLISGALQPQATGTAPWPGTEKLAEVTSQRRCSPPSSAFCISEGAFLSFSLHCEVECYLQFKRRTENEAVLSPMATVCMEPHCFLKKKHTGSQLGDGLVRPFPCPLPGVKRDMCGIEPLWGCQPSLEPALGAVCDTALQPRGALGSIICKLRRVYILSCHCNSFKRRHWNLSDQKTLKSALCFPTTGLNGSTGLDPIIQALKIPFLCCMFKHYKALL